MVSEYQENRFFNDEKDGDSPELTRAKRAFNKALRREYSRRNGYDEDGDYIRTDNNQRVPGSSFLSGLRLGNRQEETPLQGVRLALNDYTNSMSDTPIRLAQSNSDKLGVNQTYVSKYEKGERRLDLIEFLEIAEAVGFDPLDFIKRLQDSK